MLNRAKGCGPETANHYVRAVRGFFRRLVKAKRFGSNPLDSLTLVNSAVDVRHARRELTADELRRLFVATRTSHRSFRGLAGPDRYRLYLVAAGTGFRSRALANLTPADFDIEAGTVTLPARFNKSGRMNVQPLPSDVADALGEYLTGKPASKLVWGGTWATGKRGATMIRRDLEGAGIPYTTEGPDGPEYADFHALRHSFLTLGGRSGIDLRTLQELAGHSKPELTARYSHRRLYDLAGACGQVARPRADGSHRRPERTDNPPPHDRHGRGSVRNHRIACSVFGRSVRRSAGRSDRSEGGIADAELAALVAAWPTLPDHIKAAVRALLGTVAGPSNAAPR